MNGFLFVFEGPDEVGKTSIIKNICTELKRKKYKVKIHSFPGNISGTLGKHINKLHHYPNKFNISSINAASLQILHLAAHIDCIIRFIMPDLNSDSIVLLDRYWWSTYVYGKVSGVKDEAINRIIALEQIYWQNYNPTCLFLINRNLENFKSDYEKNIHENLVKEYFDLAGKESNLYPVKHVYNNNSMGQISKSILNQMNIYIK